MGRDEWWSKLHDGLTIHKLCHGWMEDTIIVSWLWIHKYMYFKNPICEKGILAVGSFTLHVHKSYSSFGESMLLLCT